MAIVYSVRRDPFLKPEDLENFFAGIDSTKTSHVSPDNPKGGDVYVFYTPQTEDYWKNDNRKWTNYGLKKIPRTDPFLYKTYHAAKTPDGVDPRFVRHGYTYINKSVPYTLVHYVGDETLSGSKRVKGVRGSRKNKYRSPDGADGDSSVLDVSMSESGDGSVTDSQPTGTPDILKQLSLLKKEDAKKGDAAVLNAKFLALLEINGIMPGFMKEISLAPETLCVMSYDSMTSSVLAMMNNEDERRNAQLVLCSANVKSWDMFVSYFMIHHAKFPFPVPLIVAIHERRTLHVHHVMMRSILEHLPWANDLKYSVCTDIERFYSFCNPLPSRLKSWTSILNDVIKVIRENNIPMTSFIVYINDIIDLVACTSNDEFGIQLKKKILQWGTMSKNEYLQRCLVNIFEKHAKQWGSDASMDESTDSLSSPFTEINNMIDRTGIQVDDVVYRIYFLQRYFAIEAQAIVAASQEVQVLYLPEEDNRS